LLETPAKRTDEWSRHPGEYPILPIIKETLMKPQRDRAASPLTVRTQK
jgi:hypothetical protein